MNYLEERKILLQHKAEEEEKVDTFINNWLLEIRKSYYYVEMKKKKK